MIASEKDFIRDPESGALVNRNKRALDQRKMIRANEARIEDLERKYKILLEILEERQRGN